MIARRAEKIQGLAPVGEGVSLDQSIKRQIYVVGYASVPSGSRATWSLAWLQINGCPTRPERGSVKFALILRGPGSINVLIKSATLALLDTLIDTCSRDGQRTQLHTDDDERERERERERDGEGNDSFDR